MDPGDGKGNFKEDGNAFIFSLNRKERYDVHNPVEALFCHKDNAAGFNYDLQICAKDQYSVTGYSSLGDAYKRPIHLEGEKNNQKAKEYLGGKDYGFKVTHYEVHQLSK